jgi:hypothetical protein
MLIPTRYSILTAVHDTHPRQLAAVVASPGLKLLKRLSCCIRSMLRAHLQHGRGSIGSDEAFRGSGCPVTRRCWTGSSCGGCTCRAVDVVADELDDREGSSVIVHDHTCLSRQAYGARSKHWIDGWPAAPWRRSSGGCSSWKLELLLDAFEFSDRT